MVMVKRVCGTKGGKLDEEMDGQRSDTIQKDVLVEGCGYIGMNQ